MLFDTYSCACATIQELERAKPSANSIQLFPFLREEIQTLNLSISQQNDWLEAACDSIASQEGPLADFEWTSRMPNASDRPIRLGFFGGDWHMDHPVGRGLSSFFKLLNKDERFYIIAFSTQCSEERDVMNGTALNTSATKLLLGRRYFEQW